MPACRSSVASALVTSERRFVRFLTLPDAHSTVTCLRSRAPFHGTGHRRSPQENAAPRPSSRLRREDGAVRRLGHAGRILRHRRRAPGRARHAPALFDVSHMGEIEIAGKDALAAVQRISCNDASKLQVGQAQYSGLLTPEGTFVDDLLVYRLGAAALPAGRQRRATSPRTTPGSPSRSSRRRRRRRGRRQLALRADRRAGARGARGAAAADRRRPGVDEVLLVRPRRGRERPRHRVAHRLHRRGRLRDLRAAAVGRPGVAGDARVRARRPSIDPVRPRRPRHAAPRSRRCACTATTSTRRRRALEADLGWIVGWKKDDFIGADGAARSRRPTASPRKLVGFEMLDRGIARTATRSYVGGQRRSASSPAARRRRS